MDCDGSYECCAAEHVEGCLSGDLDPSSEHALRPVGNWLEVAPGQYVQLDETDERW